MDIKSFGGAVTGGGSGAANLIAVWSSATVINAYSNFSYDGTTFKLPLDMQMNEAGTAAAQAVIRNRANTGSVALWGASTITGGTVEAFGNSHATKANYVEIGAGGNAYLTVQPAGITAAVNLSVIKATSPNVTIQDTAGAIGTNTQPQLIFKDSSSTIGLVGWNGSTSYDLTFRNYSSVGSFNWIINATSVMAIDQNGKLTVGASGSTQFHAVRGRGWDITYSNIGVTAYVSLVHSGASGNSGAQFYAQVTAGSSGDPALALSISSVTDWVIGIDNSTSDAFKISNASALGTNDYFQISTSGVVTIGTGTGTTHVLNTATAASASAGAGTLPATPEAFWVVNINGTNRKIAYYPT